MKPILTTRHWHSKYSTLYRTCDAHRGYEVFRNGRWVFGDYRDVVLALAQERTAQYVPDAENGYLSLARGLGWLP